MTAWYTYHPLSHPWMPSRKRKHSDASDFDSTSTSDADPQESLRTPSMKRRRYDLARNLSQLSLFGQAREPAPFQPPSVFQNTPLSTTAREGDLDVSAWSSEPPVDAPMDADGDAPVIDVVIPIVEEPADVRNSIPEVRMHNTSSYEPEKDRIVVTDLDSSEDEAETPPHTAGNDAQYSVSPAFLSRIKASKFTTPLMKPPSPNIPDPSRALVLFKPSPWIAKHPHELEGMYRARDAEQDSSELSVIEVPPPPADTDAMEIE